MSSRRAKKKQKQRAMEGKKAFETLLLREAGLRQQDVDYLRKHLDKIWEHVVSTQDRLQDLEIQGNLLTRLLSTIALERIGMSSFSLMRTIKRVEKETIAADQIALLERIFKLEARKGAKSSHRPKRHRNSS